MIFPLISPHLFCIVSHTNKLEIFSVYPLSLYSYGYGAIKQRSISWINLHDSNKMMKYLDDISWETEVWVAESPTHLIHFNGERFLGPYEEGD